MSNISPGWFRSIKCLESRSWFYYLLLIPLFFLSIKTLAQDDEDGETEQDNTNTAQFCLSKSCYSVFSSLKRQEDGGKLLNVQFDGPDNIGGRTKALMADVTNPSHLIAGGVLGGLWASYDAGQTWSPINDTAVSLSVTCIAQDNFRPRTIYYGGGQVYRDSPPTGVGIFKSTDDGATFALLPASTTIPGFLFCNAMKSSVSDSNTLYIATYSGGLYKTTDAGQSFEQVFPDVNVTDIACFPDGQVMIAVYGLGIYVSPTGNAGTFNKITSGMPEDDLIGNMKIDYCKAYPNEVFAVCGTAVNGKKSGLEGVYRSTDEGITWDETSNPDDSFNFLYPDITLLAACSPVDPAFVICGGANLTYSFDSGKSWNVCHMATHVDQQTVVFNPDDPNQFYLGADGGIFSFNRSTISSKYTNLNSSYDVTQFSAGAYFPSGMSALAGSWDNWPQLFLNGDPSFTKITKLPAGSDDNSFFCQVNQQNSNTSYVEAPQGILFRADNTLSGAPTYYPVINNLDSDSDGQIDEGALHDNPFEINLLDGQQLYYLTGQRVWGTSNGGQKWEPIMDKVGSLGIPSALGVSYDLSPTVYLGGGNGTFFRIDNANTASPGGETNLSNSVPSNLKSGYISCITVDPEDKSKVLVSYNDNSTEPRLMRVTQATGPNPVWTSISGDLPQGLGVEWVEIDPQNADSFFFAATDYGLYSTVDGGAHWNKESLPNVKILNIRLRKSDRKLFIFTAGRGMWTGDLPLTIGKSTAVNNHDKPLDCLVYPNPSDNFVSVQIEGITVGRFQLNVMDNLGKRVLEEEFTGTAGTLNISSLAIGIYYMQVEAGNKNSCMRKIIKL